MNRDKPEKTDLMLLLKKEESNSTRIFAFNNIPFYRRYYYRLESWFSYQLDEEIKKAEPFIWLMLPFMAGILFYFNAPQEPNLTFSIALSSMAAFSVWFFREKGKAFYISLSVLFFLAAFSLSAFHSQFFGHKAIPYKVILKMEGVIESYEKRADGSKRLIIGNLKPLEKRYDVPKRVRLRVASKKFKADVNDRLKFLAELSPPPGPVMPGGYDFARNLYFQGIGATGFIYGTPEIIKNSDNYFTFSTLIRLWRQNITRKINQAFLVNEHEEQAGIAAALLVGERGQINAEVRDSLAISGLAHILAISGLHMALVVATVILILRSVLARIEAFVLNYPIRTIAVISGIATGSIYYLLSGGSISASRAFIMVLIMAFALLAGRKALSIRNVALAAFFLLLISPDALLGPGFQMSFAATLSLIAFSSYWVSNNEAFEEVGKFQALKNTLLVYIKGLLVTSLIAGFSTGLFAAFHFNQIAPLGLLSNLLALPIFTILIMPFGFLGLLLMPLGYEIYPFYIMGIGIETVLNISDYMKQLTGNYAHTGLLKHHIFFLMALFLIFTCLLKSKLKWFSLGLLISAGFFLEQTKRPDLFIAEDGKTIAFRYKSKGPKAKENLLVSGKRAGRFEVKVWRAALGLPEQNEKTLSQSIMKCTKAFCLIQYKNYKITHIKKPEAFTHHCKENTLVITPLRAPKTCKDIAKVIDRKALRQSGAQMVYIQQKPILTSDSFEFKTAIPIVKRLWHSHYENIAFNIDE